MKGLTLKQHSMLDFIEEFMHEQGMAPTVYEIADHYKIKTSTVFAHIRALQRKGFLTRSSKARSICLTKPKYKLRSPTGLRSIPVMDQHSGKMKKIFCDASFIGSNGVSDVRNLYAIRVQGETLKPYGIYEGDIAIIRKHPNSLKQGDIILMSKEGNTAFQSCLRITGDAVECGDIRSGRRVGMFHLSEQAPKGVIIGVQRSL